MTESKKQIYNNAYNKQNYTAVTFRLNNRTDSMIIDMLRSQENQKAYICKLITKDINAKRARAKRVVSSGNQSIHDQLDRFPFEVIEELPNHDRYTVGYTEDLDSAAILLMNYAQQTEGHCGSLGIYHRSYDPDLKCIRSVRLPM